MKTLQDLINELPPDLQEEVRDFAQLLLEKKRGTKQKHLRQTWAGALKEYRDQYMSLELQKKALDWRGD